VFNVTGKALEETATEIIKVMVARRKQAGLSSPIDEP
jgi:regulator of PEP synthase PpsR (kinase-PPPase family)